MIILIAFIRKKPRNYTIEAIKNKIHRVKVEL